MDNDTFRAIRILAFTTALQPDYDFLVRRTQRWYSTTFSTSLVEVEKISDEKLFQVWFENQYDDMVRSEETAAQNQIEEVKQELIRSMDIGGGKTVEDIAREEDDIWEQQMLKEIAEEEVKRAANQKKKAAVKIKKASVPPPKQELKPKKVKPLPEPNLIDKEVHASGEGETGTPDFIKGK